MRENVLAGYSEGQLLILDMIEAPAFNIANSQMIRVLIPC